MKLLVRCGAMLGLAGSSLLFTVLSGNAPVLALPEQQIIDKLNAVPVFLITNSQGLPLSRPVPEAQKEQEQGGSVTGVYLSQTEAQAFISELQNVNDQNPDRAELVNSLQVTAVPLGVIYQQLQQTKNQPDRLLFAFNPVDREVMDAMDLLRASGQQVEQFRSVPLFAVRFAPDQGYVPIKMGSQQQELIPLFFSKQDAQDLLNQVKQQFSTADIQVVDLDGVIKILQEKNDQWLEQVVLVPDKTAREYIESAK